MSRNLLPTRSLRERPHLDQLKRQAKELLDAFRGGDPDAVEEVRAHDRAAEPSTFGLHDAQLVLARAYGFASWPKLKAFVDGATVGRLIEAVGAGDLDTVRAMVSARPELVHLDVAENDEHQALHHAVLERKSDIVRFLMQQGADPGKGIWPHRGATAPYTLAVERGYDEIAAIIKEEYERRTPTNPPQAPSSEPRSSQREANPLREAVASGDAAAVRASQASGRLENGHRLVSAAVEANRPDMLALLLDLGLDPDESGRVDGLEEVVPTWGEPLRACAIAGHLEMAGILLTHGANPTTNVYASSSALYEAYKRRDEPMKHLLERHGGQLTAVFIADLGLVSQAKALLAQEAGGTLPEGIVGPRSSLAQDLLWGAIEAPSPEIIALALQACDWPTDDERWYGILENGLYLGPDSDRPRHLEAFRLVLDRCDAGTRSRGRGTTLLHEVAASRGGLTPDDRIVYSTLLLDRGSAMSVRDEILESTPLGWACRWGRIEMVRLLLERGADPIEADAQPWARPLSWARQKGHEAIVAILEPLQNG